MKKRLRIAIPVLLVALGAVLYFAVLRPRWSSKDLLVSGTIEVTDSELSFKIAGRLLERLVDEGQSVEAGQLIARLDPADQKLQVARAEADLSYAESVLAESEAGSRPEEIERAHAQMLQAKAALDELEHGSRPQEIADAKAAKERQQANLESARREYDLAKADYDRAKDLFAGKVIGQQDFDQFRTRYETAQKAVDAAQAAVQSAQEQLSLREEGPRTEDIDQAKAALKQAEATYALMKEGPRKEEIDQARAKAASARQARDQARQQLDYTELHAPFRGVVMSKSAEPGEFLNPGSPVVTIAALDSVWLRAYVNETHLNAVRLGQEADVTTDAYPGRVFKGRVAFISSQAEFTPKSVQTFEERVKLMYRIKIDLDNADHALKPGMPADAHFPRPTR